MGKGLTFLQSTLSATTDKCVEWPFARNPTGYGRVYYDKKLWNAHRLVLFLKTGVKQPTSIHAAHNCNNRGCINYKHLRWATVQENADDKVNFDGVLKGEAASWSKLTEKQVVAIRQDTRPVRTIAKDYGVSPTTIYYVRTNKRWEWVHL